VSNRDLRILKGRDVQMILDGAELVLIDVVQAAYEAHSLGQSTLPHSSFLRFPDDPVNRIIALPAFLSGDFELAGIKWIASFPDNVEQGLARASAVVVLNSARTGRPEAILEGSHISAQRTAASAALAARMLHADSAPTSVGLIGGGLINFETLRFLKAVYPGLGQVLLFDTSAEHAVRFKERCMDSLGLPDVRIVASISDVLAGSALVACATTAVEPHIRDISMCPPGSTILHTSLRDVAPEIVLECDNVVDDSDHVCRANTSLHLAEQLQGSRDFIRCSLADVTSGRAPARPHGARTTLFSPFGLGVLDLAVSQWVVRQAEQRAVGTLIKDFLP
jgi:N-[(2S)-2-amino-2-carboxyethyl]-L-glutamate dehydrogenase